MPDRATSFHAATLRLLDATPHRSESGVAELCAAEHRLGVVLPQSVREWYSYENAIQILAEHSNDDPPIAMRDLVMLAWQSRRLLPIRHENQGVCTWAIELDGSEDPPVLVDVDSDGRDWQPLADCFSNYVYSCIWDYRKIFGRPALVQAQNGVLGSAALAALSAMFSAGVRTHGWPCSTQYRFYSDDAALLIWSAPDQADWFVAASNAAALNRAVRAVSHLDDVGAALYDCSPMGEAVLRDLRGPV